ncbi:M1 family metallopeptidase [Maribacter aurantiacus]|uniref:Aminopeptidase N n=1 Tax=Maribacter aurantiacus TaxID=1882343 RepID=A0A5R8M583_9FLAO|nr:M1 family metallopeptidase [Maribacter aurantiacus]TLF44752.1 M1 family metallopeptidase [Maribacter aurantiacus]
MYRFLFVIIFCSFAIYPQHQEKVDFLHAAIEIRPILNEKRIDGQVLYTFKVLERVDSVWLDARNMEFAEVRLDGKSIGIGYADGKLTIGHSFEKGSTHELLIRYSCSPKQTVYFIDLENEKSYNSSNNNMNLVAERSRSQVWTQGQGKYTSHWLPSFDAMEEKVEFDMDITVDTGFEVIANGILLQRETKDEVTKWQFDMVKPMSSYLLAFVIGEYDKQELMSESGVALENYFYPEDSLRVEPTYRYTKEIFDFFETEIGVAYPWQNYKQVPVHDFLYAGMENTGATIFSDAYVIDSTAFIDRNYVNINAHEMAHQWFGNLVTEKDGNHHWLHEGFATYYAYLAEKQLFGADHFYWKLFDTAHQLEELSESGKGESLLDPKASSLTFYEKGAWALVMLREEVGDDAFRKGVASYLEKYAFKNVTVQDFLREMEIASKKNLNDFKSKWLDSTEFHWDDAKTYLTGKNESLKNYFYLQDQIDSSDGLDNEKLMGLWNQETPVPFKTQLLFEDFNQIPESTIHKISANENSLEVRQALAMSIPKVTPEFKTYFEPFLQDKSYLTQEYALFKLWEAFPENRVVYLNKLEDVVGLPNKNVRLLWLALALVTPEYNPAQKQEYLAELVHYSDPNFNPEVRQGAFQYLFQINGLTDTALRNLILATDHHSWQFRSYVRNLLDELLKDAELKNRLVAVAQKLKDADLRYLKTKIELP